MQQFGYYCDRRIRENVACKIKQLLNGTSVEFVDYYFDYQNLFYIDNSILYILHPNNCNGNRNTSLFTEWMYNGEWLQTTTMLNKIDKELQSVHNFSLPNKFNTFFDRDYKSKYWCHHYFK